jgi:hypothetical protein
MLNPDSWPDHTATYSHYEKLFGMAQHDTANLETAVKLYDDTFQVFHFNRRSPPDFFLRNKSDLMV